GGVCAGSDRCGREEGTDRGEPCGVGAVRDAVLRGVAEADGAGGSGGVYGEQGAILGGAELRLGTWTTPPSMSIRFNFPPAKKPIERLSGDQKGGIVGGQPASRRLPSNRLNVRISEWGQT